MSHNFFKVRWPQMEEAGFKPGSLTPEPTLTANAQHHCYSLHVCCKRGLEPGARLDQLLTPKPACNGAERRGH